MRVKCRNYRKILGAFSQSCMNPVIHQKSYCQLCALCILLLAIGNIHYVYFKNKDSPISLMGYKCGLNADLFFEIIFRRNWCVDREVLTTC